MNGSGADIAAGDLVLIGLPNQPPEICRMCRGARCNITPTRGQAPSVTYWPLYQHHPLRSLPQDGRQGGADLTHFISMECTPNTAWDIFSEKVEALQEDAALVFPIGKKIKVTSMHLTLATLLLKEEEVQKVQNQLPELTQTLF